MEESGHATPDTLRLKKTRIRVLFRQEFILREDPATVWAVRTFVDDPEGAKIDAVHGVEDHGCWSRPVVGRGSLLPRHSWRNVARRFAEGRRWNVRPFMSTRDNTSR